MIFAFLPDGENVFCGRLVWVSIEAMRPDCPHLMTRLSHNFSLDLRLLPKELVANELYLSCQSIWSRSGTSLKREP